MTSFFARQGGAYANDMKSCFAKFLLLVTLLGLSGRLIAAQNANNWYWFEVAEGSSTQFYRGTTPLDEVALLNALRGTDFLRIDNLTFVKCGEIKDWSMHNPELKNHVFLNPKFVISVHPLSGDPHVRKQNDSLGCKS